MSKTWHLIAVYVHCCMCVCVCVCVCVCMTKILFILQYYICTISKLRCAIYKLRKLAKCAKHIYNTPFMLS